MYWRGSAETLLYQYYINNIAWQLVANKRHIDHKRHILSIPEQNDGVSMQLSQFFQTFCNQNRFCKQKKWTY